MRRLAALLLASCLLAGCAAWEAEDLEVEQGWESYQQLPAEEPEEPTEVEPEYPAAFSLAYQKGQTLDPISCGEGVQEAIASLLYEPLFRLDSQFQAVPLLCESYEWNEAGTVCTLTLRRDALFSDGTQLTARDVVETLQRAMASERYAYRLRNVAGAAANRAGQVVITLAAPDRGLPELLDIPIVKRGTGTSSVPTGTGPYLLVTGGGGAYLTANEDWWQRKSFPVDTIPLVHAKDRDSAMYLFSSHQVELLTVDPTDDLAFVTGQAQTAEQSTTIMQFIGFNTAGDRLFTDPALRRAFSRGIQREVLVNAQLADLALAAHFPVSPLSPLYPKDLEASSSAGETAAALREAGQDTGDPKELKLLVSSDDSFRANSARFIASSLSMLDWTVTVEELPWEEYLAALESGEFDLYFGEVRLTANWDLSDLVGTGGAMNYGGYTDGTTDALLAAFAAAGDRTAAARQLMFQLQHSAPIAPICFKSYTVLTHHGVVEGVSPTPSFTFTGFDAWRIHLSAQNEQSE